MQGRKGSDKLLESSQELVGSMASYREHNNQGHIYKKATQKSLI